MLCRSTFRNRISDKQGIKNDQKTANRAPDGKSSTLVGQTNNKIWPGMRAMMDDTLKA